MAVVNEKDKVAMVIVVDNGLSAAGAQLYKKIRFSTVRTDATDDAILAVATEFAGLLAPALSKVQREDTGTLANA